MAEGKSNMANGEGRLTLLRLPKPSPTRWCLWPKLTCHSPLRTSFLNKADPGLRQGT